MRKGFTIVELLVIVIVIGLLSTLAIPAFRVTQERALDKEAKAVILLIQAAEKVYRMEQGNYYPSPSASISNNNAANTRDINDSLKLDLAVFQASSSSWSYTVDTTPVDQKEVRAVRNKTGGRVLSIRFTSDTMACTPNSETCYLPL